VIVVAGEALIDMIPVSGQPNRFDARLGGASFNVAIGLARLDRQVSFLGRISADVFGRQLGDQLAAAGVDTSLVAPAAEPTTLSVTALDAHGKAEYGFYANGTADWQWTESSIPAVLPAGARALYAGGLALRFPPGAAVLEELMWRVRQDGEVLIFFDPNVRSGSGFSADAERGRVERQLELAHVIKASEDDITLLYPGRHYRDVAAGWQRKNAGTVIVTLGPHGAYALTAGGAELSVPAAPVKVVDTVGAGDAFSAALLDGLLPPNHAAPDPAAPDSAAPNLDAPDPAAALARISADATRHILERACVSAAYTCGQVGAQCADAQTLAALVHRAHYPDFHGK
jgi:fructokinase